MMTQNQKRMIKEMKEIGAYIESQAPDAKPDVNAIARMERIEKEYCERYVY